MLGTEAMEGSVAVYASVKMAAHNNVPGAQAAYNDMKERFPGRSKKTDLPLPPVPNGG